ncbi:MAG: NAD(+)/NADH kinase [Clostridiales bacterium]|nr:NAD(+)/NADH kinase [Clostridiales bacterium]
MVSNKIINIIHSDSNLSLETAKLLKEKLLKLGYYVSDTFDYVAELIICIGGDGSFLRTMHKFQFPDIPIIGINTGHLGFFSDLLPEEIDDFLNKYINNDFYLQEISPVEAIICTRTDCISALGINEIVIKGDKSRTVHLNISVNDKLMQSFSGDGILVASSTGSTAYNYSVGGSIIDPRLNVLQITPIAPINTTAYRSFTSSTIFPSNATIKINPEYNYENSIVIVCDGEEYRHNGIVEVVFYLSELKIRMLRLEGYEFWNKTIKKFL